MTYRHKHTDRLLLIGIAIIGAIYSVFSYLTPFQYDDYAFLGGYLAYTDGVPTFEWDSFRSMCLEIRNFDNGRLANILDLFVVLCVPKWIFAICTGIVTAGLFLLLTHFVSRLSNLQWHTATFPILTLIWAVSMVAFPWRDNILVPDYALNYLYSTFLTLWFLACASRCQQSAISRWKLIGWCILAIVAGAFHEGFSMPVMAGMVVYAMTRRFRLHRSWWAVVTAYAIGTILVCSSPSIWLRAGREITTVHQSDWISTLSTMIPLALVAIVVLVPITVIPAWRRRFHHLWLSQVYVVSTVGMAVSVALCYLLTPLPRNGWFAEVLSVIVLFPIALSSKVNPIVRKGIRASSIILFSATCVFMAGVLKWQHFFYLQDRQIHSLIEKSEKGNIYFDVFPPENMPKHVLFQPTQSTWVHSFQIVSINNCARNRQLIAVLPTALRGFRMAEAVPVSNPPGLYTYNSILIDSNPRIIPSRQHAFADNGQRSSTGQMEITTDSGKKLNVLVDGFRFISSEGDTLFYLRYPLPSLTDTIIRARWVE